MTMPLQLVNLPRAMEYVAAVEISSLEFLRVCKDIVSIGDCIMIAVSEENERKTVAFSAVGDKSIECQATISFTEVEDSEAETNKINVTMTQPVTLDYSLRFIVLVSKAFTLSNEVKLKLHKRYPLSLLYKLEGESELEFFIAPKVKEEAPRPNSTT
jgi:proliferating cell nuclear antigen